jgi:hypothetical protein
MDSKLERGSQANFFSLVIQSLIKFDGDKHSSLFFRSVCDDHKVKLGCLI